MYTVNVWALESVGSEGIFLERNLERLVTGLEDATMFLNKEDAESCRRELNVLGGPDAFVVRELEVSVSWRYASYEA